MLLNITEFIQIKAEFIVSGALTVNFTTHWANSADDKLMIFSYFLQKTGFDISFKVSPFKTICMECQNAFFGGEKKEKYFKMSSAVA